MDFELYVCMHVCMYVCVYLCMYCMYLYVCMYISMYDVCTLQWRRKMFQDGGAPSYVGRIKKYIGLKGLA